MCVLHQRRQGILQGAQVGRVVVALPGQGLHLSGRLVHLRRIGDDFHIGHTVACGLLQHRGHGVGNARAYHRVELAEGAEELTVSGGLRRAGQELAHRQGIHHPAIQRGIARCQVACRLLAVATRRRAQAQVVQLHAGAILAGPLQVVLGIHRAGQMVMQVAALGHRLQPGTQLRRLIGGGAQQLRHLLLALLCRGSLAACLGGGGQQQA
ncbi:hypothetical protein XPU_1007 [Xanthomonas arboricola pv. pruni str. MAFF 311562]|uniref:Uncharacterized protein n=1 Tax=Xanthomonas arboricola pv. pruni str. MAFF 311562 TaxID=1414836 RepID=W4RYP5_9XANT|nr:hypothetical protein XPU_1007 [Xanthomonas arboricola pv. pruni str. MAFF 311562]